MKPLDTVLERLENVKRSGGQWTALCPAHDDHRRSLSVSEGADGKVLLYCHAGCSFDAIIAALGLKPEDAFSDNGRKPCEGQIVAKYDYRNADGTLLFQVVRKEPKSFFQRRPDGSGGWLYKLGDIERVLYRLPELLESDPDTWVFVCEGEKSTKVVASLGLVATTNAGGAGKWRQSYSETLQDRKVCILPDNDPQGEQHASEVAASLKDKALEVRIVHLPSVTNKSDPSDWIAAGGTKEDLLAMVEEAQNVHDLPFYWDGEGQPTTSDYITALSGLGYHFKMNICNDIVEVNGVPMSDALRSKMRSQMRDLNYRHVNVMEDALIANAYDNSYHPVREYLNGLKWDGSDHITHLTDHFVDKNGYFHTFIYRWLIGAVARAFESQSCQNRMLVLDGGQGLGKSYFVRWLASPLERSELFLEGPINPDDKDSLVRLITTWIWEVSELGSTTRRSDREALKYFLSMQQVTVRKPYGRYDLVKPALAAFIGTVNNTAGFLNDPTGYRRFMSVHLQEVNWSYDTEVDIEQVWAQAKALYDTGESWQLTPQEVECAKYANQEYEVEDPLQDIFLRHYEITNNPADFVATMDIRDTLNTMGNWHLRTPRSETMAIADMMKQLNAEKGRRGDERGYSGVRKRTKGPAL